MTNRDQIFKTPRSSFSHRDRWCATRYDMSRKPSVSKAARAVQKLGLPIAGVEIAPDGTVRILTGARLSESDSELEAARERRRARKVGRAA